MTIWHRNFGNCDGCQMQRVLAYYTLQSPLAKWNERERNKKIHKKNGMEWNEKTLEHMRNQYNFKRIIEIHVYKKDRK